MNPYTLGKYAARRQLGLTKAGESNPLIQGAKADTTPEEPPKAPETPVWPPPPHATSGTGLNPKVAAEAPPAYQPALGARRCDTCHAYQHGQCVEYSVGVKPDHTCSSWSSKS